MINEQDVTISVRDRLAIDWELHHVRWLLSNARMTASGAANSYRMPPLKPGQIVAHYETSPDEHNAHMEMRWNRVLEDLTLLVHEHDKEREWWEKNKDSISLDVLKQAVRQMMGKAGGATQDEPELDPVTLALDPEDEVKPLRWLLNVRAEIARRRIFVGEIYFLMQEGQKQGVLWTEERLEKLSRRINDAAYGDEDVTDSNNEELLELVERREKAASSFKITGSHQAPASIDLSNF
jgi:hypothetical protein